MRFFEKKKRLNHFDLSVLKSVKALLAEWTGLEPNPISFTISIFYKFAIVVTLEFPTSNLQQFNS
ncbi:MAG: hypothetical protein JWP44_1804 [Mucilaginibacter sp.]|nr:hypothetical protein [Mucilaginibacter sp.]